MRLTQDIIRKLIKEQLQENQADRDALFSRMIDLISDIESAGLNYTSVYNDAKQAHVERKSQAREKMATAANRDDEMTEKVDEHSVHIAKHLVVHNGLLPHDYITICLN